VYLSELAERDIEEISIYISTRLLSPLTAKNILDSFYKAMSSLKTMPKRHPLVADTFLANLGYRMLPVKNHLIFYSVEALPSGKLEVNIERVLHEKRSWQNILKPTK